MPIDPTQSANSNALRLHSLNAVLLSLRTWTRVMGKKRGIPCIGEIWIGCEPIRTPLQAKGNVDHPKHHEHLVWKACATILPEHRSTNATF